VKWHDLFYKILQHETTTRVLNETDVKNGWIWPDTYVLRVGKFCILANGWHSSKNPLLLESLWMSKYTLHLVDVFRSFVTALYNSHFLLVHSNKINIAESCNLDSTTVLESENIFTKKFLSVLTQKLFKINTNNLTVVYTKNGKICYLTLFSFGFGTNWG